MRLKEDVELDGQRVTEHLMNLIRNEQLHAGQKLPSEMVLSRMFGLNRYAVRQAIAKLTNLGWVTPVQGKGCFVNERTIAVPYVISANTRFTDNMNQMGKQHSSHLIDWCKDVPTDDERSELGLSRGALVYRLEIVRFVEHAPLSITTSALPVSMVPNMEDHLETFHTLYGILEEYYHFIPVRQKSTIQATFPRMQEADYLDMPKDVPILRMENISIHPDGRPAEYGITRMRGDRNQCIIHYGKGRLG